MSIAEDMITWHIDHILGVSEPGATLHHLHVVGGRAGPFGGADPDALRTSVYVIDAAGTAERPARPEAMIDAVIRRAGGEYGDRGETVWFAALGVESWSVPGGGGELARQLLRQGRLDEHPEAAEVTLVYAACRDGRRWQAARWLTGPRAGQAHGEVEVLTGPASRGEGFGTPAAPVLRALVGVGGVL